MLLLYLRIGSKYLRIINNEFINIGYTMSNNKKETYMDNNEKFESDSREGFDEIVPAGNDEPVENLFPKQEENKEDKKEAQPEPASYTPAPGGFNYLPNGSYSNNSDGASAPETVYLRKPPKKSKAQAKKFGFSPVGFVAILLIVALIGAASGIGAIYFSNWLNPKPTSSNHLNDPGTITINDSTVENVVEAVYQKASPSIVGIRTTVGIKNFFTGESKSSGEGTGIVYSNDGYIITCYHVISSIYNSSVTSAKIEVFLPGNEEKPYEATVIGYNKATDIALIKINKKGLTVADFGTSSNIKVGQFAVVIGNPGGLQFMSSVSYGVISGINRSVSIEGLGEMSLIQTDAAINPGNSGGPLVNTEGKVIGMNSAKLISNDIEGMGFAIPIDTVLEIVDNIIENKDVPQPYIGIDYYTNISGEWLEENGLPKGVVVKSVDGTGPAYYAGISSGDILVSFDKVELDGVEDFIEVFSKCKPGENVEFIIYRNGRYYSGSLIIGSNNAIEY